MHRLYFMEHSGGLAIARYDNPCASAALTAALLWCSCIAKRKIIFRLIQLHEIDATSESLPVSNVTNSGMSIRIGAFGTQTTESG